MSRLYTTWQSCTFDQTGLSNPFWLSYLGNWVTKIQDFSHQNSSILQIVKHNPVHQLRTIYDQPLTSLFSFTETLWRWIPWIQQFNFSDWKVQRGPRLLLGLLHEREQLFPQGCWYQEDLGILFSGIHNFLKFQWHIEQTSK